LNKLTSLANQAYLAIKKDIVICKLSPGSTIDQGQLAKQYDFSLTPIREALKRLEQEGYVQSIPRFGYLITPITIQDVEDLFDLRLVLEQSAVRMAIQRATDEQLDQIQEKATFTYKYKDPGSYLEFLEQNVHFHFSIALVSRNRKLAAMLANVLIEMTRIFNLGLDLRDSTEEMRNEHVILAAALKGRNIQLAEKIVQDQIMLSRQRVIEMLTQRVDPQTMQNFGS
jgi:DNA-binding GntR family transcriptional regulator